jgi:hypothetical protein
VTPDSLHTSLSLVMSDHVTLVMRVDVAWFLGLVFAVGAFVVGTWVRETVDGVKALVSRWR